MSTSHRRFSRKLEHEFLKQKVTEALSKGKTQRQTATICQVSLATVTKIVKELKAEAKQVIQNYVKDELPIQYQNTLIGINQVIVRLWDSIDSPASLSERDRNQDMSLLLQAYGMRLELLSSAETLKATVNFVDTHTNNTDNTTNKKQKHKNKSRQNNVTNKQDNNNIVKSNNV